MEILAALRIALPFMIFICYSRYLRWNEKKQYLYAGTLELHEAEKRIRRYKTTGLIMAATLVTSWVIGVVVWLISK